MVELVCLRQEGFEPGERLLQERTIGAEEPGGQAGQLNRAVAARPKAHFAAGAVLQENLAIRRLKARLQGGLAAPSAFDTGKRELDVFAGAQGVGGEVGAGTKVVGQAGAADSHTIARLALGIDDFEFREDGMLAEVLDGKILIAAELAAQLDLPVLQRHVLRFCQPR